jgi:NitT/TauT family transport system substrate-binding protein
MAEALKTGEADAVMAHEPDASFYEKSGAAFMLADLSTPVGVKAALGDLYPSTALYMPKAYVEAHPQEVRSLVKACLRALAFIRAHDAEAIAKVLPPHALGEDGAAYLRTLASDKAMFETDGRMPVAGAREEWQVMTALTPKYGAVDFTATYTDRFVDAVLNASAH